jgi:hypothetical protein
MAKLGLVLTPTDLPLAELCAARLDGQLFQVDEAYSPVDQPELPATRAASLAIHCEQRLIAEQRSAAWIWGASALPPRRHELCASLGARARPTYVQRTLVREVVIDENDIVVIGGVQVTTPLRTIADLARFSSQFGTDEKELVRRLLVIGGLSLDDCRQHLDRRQNLPLKIRAWKRLQEAAAGGGCQ